MNAIRKTLQTRFALHVAARLDERAAQLAPHVAQRLKFAREQAIQKAHAARATSAWLRSGRRVAFVILMGALLLSPAAPPSRPMRSRRA